MGFKFKIPSNRTLANISVYGAVFCVSSVMYMRYALKNKIRNEEYYKGAFKALRANPGVVKLLGEPIKESGFDLSDTKKVFCDGHRAIFEINVKGPKDKGTMFFWSERTGTGWVLQKLELEVKSQPDKRFIIKKAEELQDKTLKM